MVTDFCISILDENHLPKKEEIENFLENNPSDLTFLRAKSIDR